MDHEDLRAAAHHYADMGWRVFPLIPGGKQPIYAQPHPKGSDERKNCRGECGRYGHGVHDATTDHTTIDLWWKRQPRCNIAVATGWPGPDVVDIDVKKGAPGEATRQKLNRETQLLAGAFRIARTATGGLHLYYPARPDYPQGNGAMAKWGIDFRGTGGYVAVPPSVTPAGQYRYDAIRVEGNPVNWAAIRDYLQPPRLTTYTPRTGETNDWRQLLDWMKTQNANSNNRNNGLYWAVRRAIETGAPDSLHLELRDIAVSNGLPYQEADKTMESARRHHR